MDQTQPLDWHGESNPEEPSDGGGDAGERPKPVGRLHLLSSKYGPEKDFLIYPGKNVIGRLESCQICLPASSVSKTHAVIEVPSPDGPHLLYDQESLNRTRRQRMVLMPHVRYSLQDGDTLLFGDVGCQYFVLDPEEAPESPDDSLEIPPTQPITNTNALVIEETPMPKRKMAFGVPLVQDSDKEEEAEEVVNGASKMWHLPVGDGSDSSIKYGAREHCSLASSVFSSHSATIVPESDEEGGDPSESSLSCPALRLRYKSDEAEANSVANGSVTPLKQETYPIQPGSTEAEVSPDSRGLSVAKDQDAFTDPSVTDFHLDSDTDMEGEDGMGTTSERPAVKDSLSLEVGSDTDTEEPALLNPSLISAGNGQLASNIDSDTDIEEAEENPNVLGFKPHQVTDNGDSDTDAEAAVDNTGAKSSERQESSLRREDSCKNKERADGNPEGHWPQEEADSDTDVEAVENPDIGSKTQPPTGNEGDDTDVEELSLGVEEQQGTLKDHEASGDGDTDVEMADLEKEKLDETHLQSPQRMGNKDSDTDVELKETGLQGNGDLAEGMGEVKNADAEPPKGYGAVGEQSTFVDGREPLADTEIVERLTSVSPNQHPLAISVDSDTDAEETNKNPSESSKGNHEVTSDGPAGSLEAGLREEDDSDTDMEVASPSSKAPAARDSDTDVEVEAPASLKICFEEQDTQLVPMRPSVDAKETTSSAMGLRVCHDHCKEDEDTDVEGHESNLGDEGNTDDEDDSDLAVQATQCYLPSQTSFAKAGKARDTEAGDSRCASEEEATQAFVFPSLSSFQLGKSHSSPLKDDDPDIYMLEATQPFCKGLATLSEEATQAFIAEEEEDAQLTAQQPLEGECLSEQATQPAVPISVTRSQQDSIIPEDATQYHSAEVSCSEPSSQPVDGAAAEDPSKEEGIRTVPSVQVLPSAGSQHSLPVVEKASGSEEQLCGASPEGGVSVQPLQLPGEAGHAEDGTKEKRSKLAGEARDAEQLPQHAMDKRSKLVTLVSERRRSLRISAASSPSPLPEGRSSCCGGQLGTAVPRIPGEPVAVPARHRGLRQLREPGRKMKEPKAEETSPSETPGKGEPVSQGRLRRSQRRSNSATQPKEETATVASSLGTMEPARPRKRKPATATTESLEEERPERRMTRSSSRSGGASEATPSPKDSGKGRKVGQEPIISITSSGRRLRRQSTESKPAGTIRNRPHSLTASAVYAPKVLFTGVIDEEGEHVVTKLGGTLAKSVFDCTHLVTDRVCRTVKFLCALARGIPIVTLDWLEKSKQKSSFLAPNTFLVHDPEQEKKFQFSLAKSLKKAQQKGGLLQGYEVHVTPNVKPEPEHMRDIIKCSGGTFLPRMPRAYKDKRVIISCPEDLARCKLAQQAGVPITNAEFILTGILQQEADLDTHRLDRVGTLSLTSPATSTRASKRRTVVSTTPVPSSRAKRRR